MTQDTMNPEAAAPVQQYEDYWGTDETVRWFLPDGKQYFDIQPMNEGAKTRYQKLTNRDIVLSQKREGEARVSVDPAGERHTLILESVTGWLMMQKGPQGDWSPQPFAKNNLQKWLEVAPPHIVEKLEHKIRLVNPWLQNEMKLEQIDEEIERLYELRKQKVAEEAGEGDSANK